MRARADREGSHVRKEISTFEPARRGSVHPLVFMHMFNLSWNFFGEQKDRFVEMSD